MTVFNQRKNMSPIEINIILHIDAMAEPYSPESDIYNNVISEFLRKGLIYADKNAGTGYRLTGMGGFMVEMLCNTPFPEFKDPREQEEKPIHQQ